MRSSFLFFCIAICASGLFGEDRDATVTTMDSIPVILTIGDSNGDGPGKWPDQLQKKLDGEYRIVNNSVSGRTIGFDNLGQISLNTLKQISGILEEACTRSNKFDKILICLGTNDCKAVFDDRQDEIVENYTHLVQTILNFDFPDGNTPDVYIISPPPYGQTASKTEKYRDGDKKVSVLVEQFKKMARKLNCQYINIYQTMLPQVETLTMDGVHFKEAGYILMADLIREAVLQPELK